MSEIVFKEHFKEDNVNSDEVEFSFKTRNMHIHTHTYTHRGKLQIN